MDARDHPESALLLQTIQNEESLRTVLRRVTEPCATAIVVGEVPDDDQDKHGEGYYEN
jgi:hypothetical protein